MRGKISPPTSKKGRGRDSQSLPSKDDEVDPLWGRHGLVFNEGPFAVSREVEAQQLVRGCAHNTYSRFRKARAHNHCQGCWAVFQHGSIVQGRSNE